MPNIYEELTEKYPFISYIKYADREIVGIILNKDATIVSIYDFNELPNIAYQSPLDHRNSSKDYIIIKNIFRGTKLKSYLDGSVTALDKYVIGDGERPDTISERLYGSSRFDFVVVLVDYK